MIPVNDLARGYRLFKDEYDKKAISVLESGWYILGKEVENFEKEYAEALGEGVYCAGVDNGLDAIRLGLHASGIGPGDEVIMQANGYIATTLGITQNGAIPVFVESDKYHNMDPDKIEQAITDKTKAILVTHLYGAATRMDKILDICDKYNLMLFEDCAQSHFSSYKGTNTGLFGKAGFYSFYPTKNLGGFGDGGAVVSHDKEFIEKIKVLRNYGSDYRYHNIVPGFNSRLDELQAGFLRVKLAHWDEYVTNRKKIAEAYLKGISNPSIRLPENPEGTDPIWYMFVINVDDQDAFRSYMKENGVQTDVSFPMPPYMQPAMSYLNIHEGANPYAEHDCKTVISLPMMDYMSDEEIQKVISAVNGYKAKKYYMVNIPDHVESDGRLVVAETQTNSIPFEVKRVFWVRDVADGASRGNHATKETKLILFPVTGSCDVIVNDGENEETFHLDDPTKGLFIDAMVWRSMRNFKDGCVLEALCDRHYGGGWRVL